MRSFFDGFAGRRVANIEGTGSFSVTHEGSATFVLGIVGLLLFAVKGGSSEGLFQAAEGLVQ